MSGYINKGNGTREHQIIAAKILGRPLRWPERVHHVDGDGTNNEHSNLVICPSEAYHALLHMRTEAYDACGHVTYRRCKFCKEWDDPQLMTYNNREGKSPSYFHKKCLNAYNRRRYAAKR